MFTGIIESSAKVLEVITSGTNKSFWLQSTISDQFKVDQSVSHDGVCLTVEAIAEDRHRVTAISETLEKSNLGKWQTGTIVNIERCLQMNGRLDGHFVQGHVDTTGVLQEIKEMDGSWQLTFSYPKAFAHLMIEKGSISMNGISLTVFNVTADTFSVAIIPYTFNHTNVRNMRTGDTVNLEFDVVGKYIARSLELGRGTNG
jgi:riboflavin synthase